jgi:23S rRNA (uracil1939-C5)-methyltransferase
LAENAAACGQAVKVVAGSVEEYLASGAACPRTVLVDPPRTGLSREALSAVSRLRAARIVYVSCDPPTMARDARRLLDGGYRLSRVQAFDLFPNTPHVETVGIFDAVTV